jgi:hypothetical protein
MYRKKPTLQCNSQNIIIGNNINMLARILLIFLNIIAFRKHC